MLFETLQDNFNDNSLDGDKWLSTTGAGGTVSETNRRIQLTMPAASTSSTIAQIGSRRPFNLEASYVFVEIIETPNAATNVDAEFIVQRDSNNWFRWVLEAGTLYAQRKKAGVQATLTSFAFNAVTHRWWRIRETSGIVYFETSSDRSTWTAQTTYTHGMALANMNVFIGAFCYQNETNPGNLYVDNFNINFAPPEAKQFITKVYDASGNYLTTWEDILEDISYSQEINSAASELVIKLGREASSFGEDEDVKFKNIVKVYIRDREYVTPTLIFQGYIANYRPIYDVPEYVEVIVYSFGFELKDYIHGADETANVSQATGTSSSAFGYTTLVAQSFVPSVTTLSSIDVKLSVVSPRNVTLTIRTDNSGQPSTAVVSNSTVIKEIASTSATVHRFIFGSAITVTSGQTYWMVLQV